MKYRVLIYILPRKIRKLLVDWHWRDVNIMTSLSILFVKKVLLFTTHLKTKLKVSPSTTL